MTLPEIQPGPPPAPAAVPVRPDRTRNILLLVFSLVGLTGLVGRAIYMIISGIVNAGRAGDSGLAASMLGALSMLLCAGLLLPMVNTSLKRLRGQQVRPLVIPRIKAWQAAVLLVGWIFAVAAGGILTAAFPFGWAVSVPFFILGMLLPPLALVWLGIGGLPAGSRHRLWSVFGVGLVGGPMVAIVIEYLFVGVAAVGFGLLAATNPGIRSALQDVQEQLTGSGNLQDVLLSLGPYLTNAWIVLLVLVFASGIAPLVEEAVKPAVLWLLGKRLQTPAEGFVIGVLCGAGFATLEGLTAASGATEGWAFGILARAAATLMHISSSGILGWGIASALLNKRYGRLPLIYLLSVSLHGLWNGSALMAVYGALRIYLAGLDIDAAGLLLILAGASILGMLFITILVGYPIIGHQLRQSLPAPAPGQNDIIAPPSPQPPPTAEGQDISK